MRDAPAAVPTRIVRWVAIGLLAVPLRGCGSDSVPPNIVLVVLDTVRADGVGAQLDARPVTPVVDRLEREGTSFRHAYAVAPWTLPSHATLFTGLAPSQHHAVHERFVLAPQYLTLAEFLKSRGYVSYGISSNPWVTEGRGLAQGFDHFDVSYTDRQDAPDQGAARASDLAIEFLEESDASQQPFFLFVNYIEAHLPYAPPDAGLAALGIDPARLARRTFTVEQAEEIIAGEREASREELDLARTLYLAEMAYQDRQLGRVIDTLRERELIDRTLLVVTADHGEALGTDGLMGHEFTLSDDVLHVPLIFRYPPRIRAGRAVERPVSHLDVVPTILDAIGGETFATKLEGRSLLDLAGLSPDRPLLAEYAQPRTLLDRYWATRHPDFDTSVFAVALRSLRKGPLELVENSRGDVTLIDPDHPAHASPADDAAREATAREMREELAAWIERLRRDDPR